MNEIQPGQGTGELQKPKSNIKWFWIALVFPSILGVVGFLIGEMLGLTKSSVASTDPFFSALTLAWTVALAASILLCPLYCALVIASRAENRVVMILSWIFLSLLFIVINVVTEILTCSMFVSVNFH